MSNEWADGATIGVTERDLLGSWPTAAHDLLKRCWVWARNHRSFGAGGYFVRVTAHINGDGPSLLTRFGR